jgi:hypothetical protein
MPYESYRSSAAAVFWTNADPRVCGGLFSSSGECRTLSTCSGPRNEKYVEAATGEQSVNS